MAISCRRISSFAPALAWVLAASAALAADALPAPTQPLTIGEAVAGILDYTRWPAPPAPLQLCFLGASDYREAIAARLGRAAALRELDEADLRLDGCTALYVGRFDGAGWGQLTPRLGGLALLTLCERSPACSNAGMFALDIGSDGSVRFEVNLDAVGRSLVRIHPRVLLLGQRPR